MVHTYVIDIDGTICQAKKLPDGSYDYPNAVPFTNIIKKINQLYDDGNIIFLFTSRGMRTYNNDIKKINKNVRPVLEKWLNNFDVKYHKLIMGKPWGENVIYIDNRNLSIDSFINNESIDFESIIKRENNI